MFARRTLVSLVAVAAIAGGAAGGVTSSLANPQSAAAEEAPTPPTVTRVLGKRTPTPTTIEGVGKLLHDSFDISKTLRYNTDGLRDTMLAVARIEAQVNAINTRLDQLQEGVNGIGRQMRLSDGRTLSNVIGTMEVTLNELAD